MFFIIFLTILGIFIQDPILAQDGCDDFSISSNQLGIKTSPKTTIVGENKLLVSWENTSNTGYEGIGGQFLNEDGSFVGDRFHIQDQEPDDYYLIGLGDGFALVWQTGSSVFGQLFSSSGEPEIDFDIISGVNKIGAAGLENNTFVVCWSVPDTTSQDFGNWFLIFDKNGNRLQDPIRVGPAQFKPSVFPLSNSNFLIHWAEEDQLGIESNENARIFDQFGNSLSDIFFMLPPNTVFDFNGLVASLSNDLILVVWSRLRLNFSIHTQKFDLTGQKVGNEDTLRAGIERQQPFYVVSKLNNATVNVLWGEQITSGNYGFYGHIISDTGEKLGSEYRINTSVDRYTVPSMLPINDKGFGIFWRSVNYNGSGSDEIIAKFIAAPEPTAVLKPFRLIEPEENRELDEPEVTFVWSKAVTDDACLTEEVFYDVQIDTVSDFANPKIVRGIADTTVTVDSLARGQVYFWRVQAVSVGGNSLFNSEGARNFRIDDLFDIKVPFDYPTIQAAIDSAEGGDVIFVEAGEYSELLTIDRALTIEGANRDSVIISPPQGSEALATVAISDSDIHLKNLTISGRNGSGSLFDDILQAGGNALYISSSQQVYLENLDVRGGDGDAASGRNGTNGGHGIVLDNSMEIYMFNLYVQGGNGGYGDGNYLVSGDGGFGVYIDSSFVDISNSIISGGDGVTCFPVGSAPSAFGHAIAAINGSIVTVLTTNAAGAEDFWCPERSGKAYFADANSYFIIDGIITDITSSEYDMPKNYSLAQNYPNPFNPQTNIEFDVPESRKVTLKIYDIQGREVQTLVDEELTAGHYKMAFNAQALASGVYFYRLRIGDFQAVKKMLLMQ